MRIHTDKLSEQNIRAFLADEITAGRIAPTVGFKKLTQHGSRSKARAFEVQLESWDNADGDGRREGNSGSYGGGENYAATHDEWGWFLAALFAAEPEADATHYYNADDFHHKTTDNYRPTDYVPGWPHDDEYPWIIVGGRGGKTGDRAGRMGHRYTNEPYFGKPEYRPRWLNGKRRNPHIALTDAERKNA